MGTPWIVETATVVVLVVLALSTRSSWELPAYLWFGGLGVAAAAVDARVRRLPNAVTAAWSIGTVTGLLMPAVLEHRGDDLLRAVLAGVTLTVVFGVVALSGALGWGDVKAAAAVGVILGWLGWVAVYAGLLAATMLAGGYAVVLLARGRAQRRARIPLGPFLVVGAVAVLTLLPT